MPTTPPFIVANDFTGAGDLGAMISAALSTPTTSTPPGLGNGPGEVLVVWTTTVPGITNPVTIGPQQTVRFGSGDFFQAESITLKGIGARLTGAGATSTRLTNVTSNKASVILDPGPSPAPANTGMEVSDLLIYRNTPVVGGVPTVPALTAVGIDASIDLNVPTGSNILERVRIRDVTVSGAVGTGGAGFGHSSGIALGPTTFSLLDRSIVEDSYSHNVVVQNSTKVATGLDPINSQWQVSDLFLQKSRTGHGMFVQTTAAAPDGKGMVLGTWTNVYTYGNAGNGLRLVGREDARINDLRVFGGFFGEDHQSAIYLDTHGAYHSIRDAFIELAGKTTTNLASGIEITINNQDVSVTGCLISECNDNGIVTLAPNTVVTGCDVMNNGKYSGGTGIGIYVINKAAEVVGNRSGNWDLVLTPQKFGLHCTGTAKVTATGNRFHDNTMGQIGGLPTADVGNLLT